MQPTVTEPPPILPRGGIGSQIMGVERAYTAALGIAMGCGKSPGVLTISRYLTMAAMEQTPGASGAQLARATQVVPQTMNTVQAGLERDGLVTHKALPGAGRALAYYLTPAGSAALARGRAAAAEVESRISATLPDGDERQALSGLLARLHRALAPVRPAPVQPLPKDGGGRILMAGRGLTSREAEVLALTARGTDTGATAAELGISVSTVRHHRKTASEKLGGTCAAQTVWLGLLHGYLASPGYDGTVLDGREQALIGYLAEGLDNADIGAALKIGEAATSGRVRNLMHRLGADNRANIVYLGHPGCAELAAALARAGR